MSDPWSEFKDVTPSQRSADPWADFKEVEASPRQRQQPASRAARDPRAIDGDTIRLQDGTLRLHGVDAPELGQQGWNREGVTVPVGQQARGALANILDDNAMTVGPAVGTSYGRTVAPVTIGNDDLARQLAREGDALGAPEFVKDPDYRFQLMQAERLARQNQLGPMHDNFVQPPAENRANPDYVPARDMVAQFFDTPTPLAGMRPEAEKRYFELLDTATDPAEVVAFVESQGGFKINPADVAAWIEARDAQRAAGRTFDATGSVVYERGPEVLTDLGGGRTDAIARGYTQGFVAGGLDELGAFPDMLGLTPGRENVWNSDRRFADIWQNNQQQNASILGYDEYAYPYSTTAANVAGGITSAFVLPGGQARTVPELARVGAAYGGAAGFLTPDGGIAERGQGAAIGATLGAVGDPLLGKAVQALSPLIGRGFQRITGRAPPRGSEAVGEAAQEYAENDLSDAAQRAARSGRQVDRIDIPPGTPAPSPSRPAPVDTAYPGPSGGRDREWIDIADHTANDNVATARAVGMDAEGMPSVSGEVRQRDYINVGAGGRAQRLDQPLSEAQMNAIAANIEPRDVLPMPSNVVNTVEEAARANSEGRIVPATAPNERGALTRRTVRNFAGAEVPKVGPIDLVGWLRLKGGLQDQGGELRAMGIASNAGRKGLDFVGQEMRFGPMVRENGLTLDDAANAAWEAGYFPDHADRPTVSEFLDAVRDTYEGNGRRFLPEDLGEIDEFYGRQAERYDLEQQQHEAGGPVFVDRSEPADDAAPFAPPEAFEEWPAETVRRAGNINLDNLDSPQNIRRALVQINNRVGFDAATRGRVTQAETERLASELGMTADDLLKRRKGQALNAEEALAARQILAKSANELVNLARRIQRTDNPGDELAGAFQRALLRHAAIQEQVSGATAEAGRALAQFKMMADARAVRSEILSAMVDSGGGPKRVREAADLLLEAIEGPPGRFNTVTRKAADPRFADKIAELYINYLLSGPQTHVVNAISNTMTAISQIPENVVAAGLGGARQLLARRKAIDRVMGGEIGARLMGLIQGTKEGARLFATALRTGETSDTFSKIAGHDLRAIKGAKGEVVRIPGRLLNSADEFFKGINRRMEINALAYRQAHREGVTDPEKIRNRVADLSANPTEAIELRALDFARYQTFQRPLSGVGQNVQRFVRDYPLLRPIITFVRTPANLLKFTAERSPLAPILKEWRADVRAGGARRDMALARAALGTGIGTLAYNAALDGRITGSAPSDPAKYRFQRADGWQPYSVRIGDSWVSYNRLDPFAMTLGVAADLATRAEGMSERQLDNYAMLMVASTMQQMADKTWLSGVSDFINALTDPERYGPGYLRNLGASFAIPNVVGQAARAADPYNRERDTFSEELEARVPGLSDNLLPQRDVWGNPVERDQLGPDLISPFRQERIKDDPVNRAMLEIGARFGPPSKQYTVRGERREWTPEQYDRVQELAGRAAHSRIAELISRPGWETMKPQVRLKLAGKVFERAREQARDAVLQDGETPQARAGQPFSLVAPAQAATVEPDEWAEFREVPQRDVVGDLERAIPGVQFTSGYRTPEYQADMRRRGYNPSPTSEHLEGGALDMLPPPGKSLGWLKRQVAAASPNARLSIHDGHLHAEFPDWYAAPVLGGAKSAGIVNPVASRRD